ncbi:Brp/Blh family beta-carotene 15,15'-dioxygenase [Nibrella viscosa]|uniref:Probable beta-carotene 15,15'-dioxygenase n=1 Tax=Nibrella viscosa TaxID=1084524 RepID=A0ABP8JTD9_9BACT
MASLTSSIHRLTATPTYLTIALGAGLVTWQAAAGTVPWLVQILVFGILLFGSGIPHGALDHLINQETALRSGHRFSLVRFLARYLLTMAVYALAWYLFPALSLLLFLVMSAFHFGEADIERVPATPAWTLTRLLAGSWVLAFILLTHVVQVTPVLQRITQDHALTLAIWALAVNQASAVLIGGGVLTSLAFAVAYAINPVAMDYPRLVRLALVLALGYGLPLLLAFGLYFGGWHALVSFQTIHGYLRQRRPDTLTAGQIWLKSLPFTALALVSLGLFVWWWQQYAHTWDPLPLLFVFLSLITLPHLGVMHGMHQQVAGAPKRSATLHKPTRH